MARIVGGIGASHAPSMEHVYDAGEDTRESDEWQPLFGPFTEVAEWLEAARPDRLIVIYNDHMDAFFLDAYPSFALGVAEVRVSAMPWSVLRAAGLGVPFLREVVAVRHQFDQDYVSDATATTRAFGLTATTWDRVLEMTHAAYQRAGLPDVIDLRQTGSTRLAAPEPTVAPARPDVIHPEAVRPQSVRRFVRR